MQPKSHLLLIKYWGTVAADVSICIGGNFSEPSTVLEMGYLLKS